MHAEIAPGHKSATLFKASHERMAYVHVRPRRVPVSTRAYRSVRTTGSDCAPGTHYTVAAARAGRVD